MQRGGRARRRRVCRAARGQGGAPDTREGGSRVKEGATRRREPREGHAFSCPACPTTPDTRREPESAPSGRGAQGPGLHLGGALRVQARRGGGDGGGRGAGGWAGRRTGAGRDVDECAGRRGGQRGQRDVAYGSKQTCWFRTLTVAGAGRDVEGAREGREARGGGEGVQRGGDEREQRGGDEGGHCCRWRRPEGGRGGKPDLAPSSAA